MRPTVDLVRYLDDYFGIEIWRPAGDLIGNISVSEADVSVRDLPLCNGLTQSQLNFTRSPGFTVINDNAIRVRVPRTDRHLLTTEIVTDSPLPNADLAVGFNVEFTASAGIPNPNIDIIVNFSWLSDIIVGALNPPALVAKRILEETIGLIIRGILTDKLREQIGGMQTYRFDRSHDLVWADPAAPQITGVFAPGFKGSQDQSAQGYCDILLAADGFTAADINQFDALADNVGNHFANRLSTALEVPFLQFRTGIRIWKMPLVTSDPTDPLQRTVILTVNPEGNNLNFSNLARAAEIGLQSRTVFGRDPIIVFVSRISDTDRQNAGIALSANIRSNAQGPYVLLDLSPTVSAADATRTLVHELGHTSLGHYLADEYPAADSDGFCTYEAGSKIYRGPEPSPRNVSTHLFMGWVKWQPWSGSFLDFFSSSINRLGAYEFDQGIFRFQSTCRMRCSTSGDFCPVCREELALGLLERGHQTAGIQGIPGFIDLQVEYLRPWVEPEPRRLHVVGGSTNRLEIFSVEGGTAPATLVRLKLVGSSVPETWQIQWWVQQSSSTGTQSPFTGAEIEVEVRMGATVRLEVRHDTAASGIFAPSLPAPETSVSLVFDLERRLTAANLQPPTDLIQSVAAGYVLVPVIDQASGRLSLSQELWLAATPGTVQGFNLFTSVEFRLEGPGNFQRLHLSNPGDRGEERRWLISRMLPPGHYVWWARTTWLWLRGAWIQAPRGENGYCFEIGNIPFQQEPQPPKDPFNLIVVETMTFPPLPVGLEASSWHPNDQPINFKFELKLQNQPWTGTNLLETGPVSRNLNKIDTVAVTGRVLFNLLPQPGSSGDFYKWRVCAADNQGHTSQWIEGRPFAVFMPAARPKTLEELSEILKTLDARIFDPKGPVKIPRLFLVQEWPTTDKETDFSKLKNLGR